MEHYTKNDVSDITYMSELTLDNFCTRHKFIANPYFKNCRGLIRRRFATTYVRLRSISCLLI
jgi:hypothetical protein